MELAAILVRLLVADLTGRLDATVGQEQVDDLRERIDVLAGRLRRSDYASETLQRLRSDPENPLRQAALEDVLAEHLTADPELAELAAHSVEEFGQMTPGSVSIRGQDITVRGDIHGVVWGGRLPGDADEEY
jgi:hypothetical protein